MSGGWDRARVDRYWEGLAVSVDTGEDGEGIGFSWAPCESCDSLLGGHRYDVSWTRIDRRSTLDEQGSGAVCSDCAMYIANEEVPDEA